MEPEKVSVLYVLITSFLVFQWIFYFACPLLSQHLVPAFNSLSYRQKTEWRSRVVSTVHALVVGILCLYILLYDEDSIKDPVCGETALVRVNLGITSGYLMSDFLLMIYFWDLIGDKYFIIHHLTALYAYYHVLMQGLLHYFANFRLIAEISTPFVNNRWFLLALGYDKLSRYNVFNGIAMTWSFFLVRITVIPFYYIQMYHAYGSEAFGRLTTWYRCAWVLCSLCLDTMNVMWMHRILQGCLKLLWSSRSQKGDKKMQNTKMD